MQLASTRNPQNIVNFEKAVLNCMPEDGGLYVPVDDVDMSRWILYINKETSFQSIAGALTSALINDEFSPIICETIATRAFPFEPAVKRLDTNLYVLELFHGPTGSHKDFGISYLVSCVDTILYFQKKQAVPYPSSGFPKSCQMFFFFLFSRAAINKLTPNRMEPATAMVSAKIPIIKYNRKFPCADRIRS